MAAQREERRLAAIFSADVVGYSRLMAADEWATLAALKAHRNSLYFDGEAPHGPESLLALPIRFLSVIACAPSST